MNGINAKRHMTWRAVIVPWPRFFIGWAVISRPVIGQFNFRTETVPCVISQSYKIYSIAIDPLHRDVKQINLEGKIKEFALSCIPVCCKGLLTVGTGPLPLNPTLHETWIWEQERHFKLPLCISYSFFHPPTPRCFFVVHLLDKS